MVDRPTFTRSAQYIKLECCATNTNPTAILFFVCFIRRLDALVNLLINDRTPNMLASFHLFPKLPQEIRDAIWRECLPRRVIEIDWPTEEEVFDIEYEWDDDDRPISRGLICHLKRTSLINAKPPIISRVCGESRAVAFETGALLEHSQYPRQLDPPQPLLYHGMRRQWVDRTRDTVVHLHFNSCNEGWFQDWLNVYGNPLRLLQDAMFPTQAIRSINETFLFLMKEEESRDMVESMSKILACLDVVVLHTEEEPAIQSGLFGMLGEERIVMVDPFDEKRIQRFRDFWTRHRNRPDKLTEKFFEECIASDPVQCRRTVLQLLNDLKGDWLRERWFDTTGAWVEEQSPYGHMQRVHKPRKVPGLVQEEEHKNSGAGTEEEEEQ
ncbi:hypothetical protein DHEL01_v202407 [Diaporthe helianthi]|uniref:2EXR domain-containing protein n=1 Tax=Diaporthe helianthi TaxID=158607 RepID=A0A2P5I9K4_DIAHE|nr:hypothetical protein DHEL01_v202407 [Diaporthe helianthi]